MARRRKKRKPSAPSRFQVGDRVRVRRGTMDTEYADMPLGGWAGTITAIDRLGVHAVQWSDETIASIHAVYKKRCERNGMMLEEYHLDEADLESDPGGPLCIAPPQSLAPTPLLPDDQDDRVRTVFGLTTDDPLPKPDDGSLASYYDYLFERVRFPFSARYEAGTFFHPVPPRRVEVVSLALESPWDEEEGILCSVRDEDELETLPLAKLSPGRRHANYQLLDDYATWFHGELAWEKDEEDDEDADQEAPTRPGEVLTEAEFLEQLRSAPWSRAVFPAVTLAVLAGFAGAVVGSAVAAMTWAKWGAAIGAALVGCLAAFTVHGFGGKKQEQGAPVFMRVMFRCMAGFIGALVGALLGTMVVAFVGALVGWAAGYLVRRQWGRRETLSLLNSLSVFMATCGVVGQAFYLHRAQATVGLLLGASACAASAVLTVAAVVFFAKSSGRG